MNQLLRSIVLSCLLLSAFGATTPAPQNDPKTASAPVQPILTDYSTIIGVEDYEEWVSPNGKFVCYDVPGPDGGGACVYIEEVQTKRKALLIESGRWIDIHWSPDSRYVAATNHWDGHCSLVEIYSLEARTESIVPRLRYTTTKDKESTDTYGVKWDIVKWNPGKDSVVLFKSDENEQSHIIYYGLSIPDKKLGPPESEGILSSYKNIVGEPRGNEFVSPNGKHICFTDGAKISIVAADSGYKQPLFTSNFGNFDINWSPDSKFIAIGDLLSNRNGRALSIFEINGADETKAPRLVYQSPKSDDTSWKVAKWEGGRKFIAQTKKAIEPYKPSLQVTEIVIRFDINQSRSIQNKVLRYQMISDCLPIAARSGPSMDPNRRRASFAMLIQRQSRPSRQLRCTRNSSARTPCRFAPPVWLDLEASPRP